VDDDVKTYSLSGFALLISAMDIIPVLQIATLSISIIYGIIQIKNKL
tara:strand:- start:600 stop:740 length:141 start_codon:yes stop_codon:yes gene_type:complete